MKKLLLIALLVIGSSAMACDGSCRCGGAPKLTKTQELFNAGKVFGEWLGYLGAGAALVAVDAPAWPLGIPALCIYASRGQAAYNKAHGITHSREKRRRLRNGRN